MAPNRKKSSFIAVLIGAAIAGELTFSGVMWLWPQLDLALAINLMYLAVKLGGDLMCRVTGRSADEWGYIEDYVMSELVNGWLAYSILLALIQTFFALRYQPGTMMWRLLVSSVVAVGTYGLLRYKKEIELASSHVLGRRARVKYGLQ